MADLSSTTPQALPSPGPSLGALRFARVRLGLAVVVMLAGAFDVTRTQLEIHRSFPAFYSFDPAPIFYLAGAVGLALRWFWARYLAICFAVAIIAVNVFWGPTAKVLAIGLPFLALLAGPTMRALFEGRAGRLNRWAAELDRRVARLRLLFVAQSVVLALLFAAAGWLPRGALPLVAAAGLTLGGLVFQRTWAALAMAPIVVLEGALAVRSIGVELPSLALPAWSFPLTLLVACGVSLAVIAPMLRAFGRKLRGAEGG
jgi:hypothetical protein